MAYERLSDNKVKGDGLDVFVENSLKSLSRQLATRNAEDESRFASLVLEGNLSLDDQLNYRKEQLKRISDDPEERRRVRGEISSLKDRIEQKKFVDEYTNKLIDMSSGISSVDSVLSWLNTQKDAATDPTIKDQINQEILKNTQQKFTLTKSLIENQTNFALKDKTDTVLDTQIGRITSEKNKALLAGNEELASTYDLHLQALTQAKISNSIERDIKGLAVSTVTGYSTATNLLDAYNAKIANASGDAPVTIGDVTYANAKEFWIYKRDSYLADQSSSGFFDRFKNESETKLKTANSQNLLTPNTISTVASDFNSVLSRPELAGYQTQVNATKQSVLQTGADLYTNKVLNNFSIDYDLPKANAELTNLKNMGVNVDDAFAKLITSAGSIKQSQVNNILQSAQTLLQNDTNMTPDVALAQAIKAGAGTVYSPKDLANKSETDISKEALATAGGGTGTNDTRTTIPQPAPAQPSTTPTTPQPATPPASTYTGNSIVDYLNSIGKPSDFNSRASVAKQYGITNYTGTAEQNTSLLETLRTGKQPSAQQPTVPTPPPPTVPPAAPTVVTPPTTPQPQQPQQPASSGSSGYSFKKTANGNVEVYQNGQRISTGTVDYAKTLGFTG